ncbi:hypothetical protein QFZ34_003003 [Phyllobacterium ifriqiyense]|uniref:Uncharacterized protein n=1 Tax=Phyllobacterium ifriqiyense TaxID=314238 RepID=A0ABU0SBI2_9HYPH|nr:hypothetical protein [Phyllobacterium ifriqiyense]
MIGLFLPCQRVVSLLRRQRPSFALGSDELLQRLRNSLLAPTRNLPQDGGRDVSWLI